MNKILLPASLDGYTPRKDGSFSLRFVTQEQNPDGVRLIHENLNEFGFLYFKAVESMSAEEQAELEAIDNLDADLYDKPKTQSQRLRNVLYKNYEQHDRGYKEFKDFYKAMTERTIQKWKDLLED